VCNLRAWIKCVMYFAELSVLFACACEFCFFFRRNGTRTRESREGLHGLQSRPTGKKKQCDSMNGLAKGEDEDCIRRPQ